MPTPRRRPWGQLWAAAPWDGKARPPEPVRAPLTEAALIDTPPPRGTLSLRRRGWGKLFQAAPWHGRPPAPPADDAVSFDTPPPADLDSPTVRVGRLTSRFDAPLAPPPRPEVPS